MEEEHMRDIRRKDIQETYGGRKYKGHMEEGHTRDIQKKDICKGTYKGHAEERHTKDTQKSDIRGRDIQMTYIRYRQA